MSNEPTTHAGEAPEFGGFCPYCMSRVPPGESCPVCGLTQGSYAPSPHHLPPGIILARRYLIGRVLGEGGFGITYIGCDLRLEVKVAIKEYFPIDRVSRYADSSLSVITRTGSGDRSYGQGLKKFLYEARTMARMEKQPQIVTVRDYFEANNTAYIVMEYVEGTDFKTLVKQRGGSIPARELLPLIEPLFSGLSAVHEAGLIHRDISPDNLMLERGMVRLLDFGCAREFTQESPRGTETMTIALKQGFAPIEQYQHNGQGPWTDVYALSAVIYYCLTGKVPPQALDRILEDELIPPRKLGVDLTIGQERALLKGLRIQPRKRYQTVEELHSGLYHPVEPFDLPLPPEPEPFVFPDPAPEPEPAPAPVPKPAPEPPLEKTQIRPTAAAAAEPPPPEPKPAPKPGPATDRRKWMAALGSGVLVFLLVLLIALGGGGSATEIDPEAVAVDSLEAFQSALNDDSVPSVLVTGDVHWTASMGPLNIDKPLYIQEDSGLHSEQAITVGESTPVTVYGALSASCGLIHLDGGTITVEDGGHIDMWDLWVRQEDDLTLRSGATLDLYGQSSLRSSEHVTVLAQDEALFADAVAVTSAHELMAALSLPDTRAIVVTSGSTITTEEGVYIPVPVLIEEGATVTMPTNDKENIHWYMDGSVLVNRGTFQGALNNGENLQTAVNYGTMDGVLWHDCQAPFYNLGTLNTSESVFLSGRLVNLGTLNHSNQYGSEWLDFRDEVFLNFGTVTVTGTPGKYCSLSSNYRIVNGGTLELGAYGQLENRGHMENFGTIALTDATSFVWNGGDILSMASDSWITAVEGSFLEDHGWITHNGQLDLPEDSLSPGICLLNASETGTTEFVTNQEDLLAVLDREDVETVVIDGEITFDGDLTVHKKVICYAPLVVRGTLTVSGEQGALYGGCELTGDSLTVTDGGKLACFSSFTFGQVTAENDGRIMASPYGEIRIGSHLSLANGGIFTLLQGMSLEDAEVQIQSGGLLRASGNLYASNSRITIEEGGELFVTFQDLHLDGDCTLTNRGKLEYNDSHWRHTFQLDGTAQNDGLLNVLSNSLHLSGALTNTGDLRMDQSLILSGTLDNQGAIYFYQGSEGQSQVEIQDGGSLTGNQPITVARNIWS